MKNQWKMFKIHEFKGFFKKCWFFEKFEISKFSSFEKIFSEKLFSKHFFYFRKLRTYSYLTSCWTPSNSFWSLRTSYLNPRDPIFYQGKPGAPLFHFNDWGKNDSKKKIVASKFPNHSNFRWIDLHEILSDLIIVFFNHIYLIPTLKKTTKKSVIRV